MKPTILLFPAPSGAQTLTGAEVLIEQPYEAHNSMVSGQVALFGGGGGTLNVQVGMKPRLSSRVSDMTFCDMILCEISHECMDSS